MELHRGAPVVYSLGNFVFGGNWNPRDKRSALLQGALLTRGLPLQRVLPTRIDRYPERPMQPYLVQGAEAEESCGAATSLALYSKDWTGRCPELEPRDRRAALPEARAADS